MKKIVVTLAVMLAAALSLKAQKTKAPDGYVWADSLVFVPVSDVDSTLAGKSIFRVLPDNVKVIQSSAISKTMESKAAKDASREMSGYRIRIYFDNSRTARGDSESALYRFKARNPGVTAYRTFDNPYFKVTVGDYRNKSEALAALQDIRIYFPSAFIVREKFRYPLLENSAAFRVDTLKYLRPKR